MKNSTTLIGIVIILIVGGYFVFNNLERENITINGNAAKNIEEVQKVVLSLKNGNYYPNEIRVKVNQPVSISLDSSVSGCLRSFTIKDFGISKYLKSPEDSVEFTPTKTGTFRFACSMGMGYGTLIVE